MKTLIVTCILLSILAARAYWQLEDMEAENVELRAELAAEKLRTERAKHGVCR